jgi:hypothetical protein
MKRIVLALCVLVLILNTGCVKSLLNKDEDKKPAEKYAGVWQLTAGAADLDNDLVLDANERTQVNVASELNLKADFTYTFTTSGGTPMSGNWTFSNNNKSISISDNTGAIRFDIQSDNELYTEPIPDNGRTLWLIYTR